MAELLPLMIRCEGRRVVIVGGGRVAERKVHGLLAAEAKITVVSPSASDDIRAWADEGRLRWVNRDYMTGDLQGAFLVYAATDQRDLNERVASEAGKAGILVNVAHDGQYGSFMTPSVVRRGRLTLAVSTSGAGPAVSKRITTCLEELFGPEYEAYMDLLYQMRLVIREKVSSPEARSRLLKQMAGEAFFERYMLTQESWSRQQIEAWIAQNQEE
ncbi:bifunctional precorrin-2 dehydrogenase/sirohydrochlorin ferrochelatase [Paenibacillus sp. JX-17]|uniref:precorrin-2 dehydrogenase n=1 Tax=Paenibacillus lacisoli TaxID=3064525 RepID=A0ABT9CCB2_9BACL|nr:bifunctional precorrin-2 dehydrogenase/sirohydrochlorin ferrochelatase [Paenibacillus sp. JX-17]MDO7906900.1 bifunctional precorrin-2 dehydrogenase/sirohydrochlorin ferrochelatase [Paenibacillus sp. JX-17]